MTDPCILYVDDDQANRLVFEQSFKSRFAVETLPSGEAALRRMAEGPVAVLFSDQRMPGMAGNELLRLAREISQHTVGIVLTAYDDIEPILEAMNSGYVSRYLIKPWTVAEIESTIRWGVEVYRLARAKGELELKLLESDRFTTLGSIAAGILHDLNQPLTIISANLESVAESVTLAGDQDGMLRDARQALEQVMQLVESALRYLATGRRDDAMGDITLAARYSIKLSAPVVLSHGGILASKLADTLPQVPLPTSALTQIMVNLLINAAQALPVRAPGSGRRDPARVELELQHDRDGVRLTVHDQGTGMTPEVQARATEPFFTTKPAGVGTGLGLFNTRTLVEQARGTLTLESRPGEGTTVTVWLPAVGHKGSR